MNGLFLVSQRLSWQTEMMCCCCTAESDLFTATLPRDSGNNDSKMQHWKWSAVKFRLLCFFNKPSITARIYSSVTNKIDQILAFFCKSSPSAYKEFQISLLFCIYSVFGSRFHGNLLQRHQNILITAVCSEQTLCTCPCMVGLQAGLNHFKSTEGLMQEELDAFFFYFSPSKNEILV